MFVVEWTLYFDEFYKPVGLEVWVSVFDVNGGCFGGYGGLSVSSKEMTHHHHFHKVDFSSGHESEVNIGQALDKKCTTLKEVAQIVANSVFSKISSD
jgi:hypothetical protein